MKRVLLLSAVEALSMELLRQQQRDQARGPIIISSMSMQVAAYDEPAPILDFGPKRIMCRACGKHNVGVHHRCPVVRRAEQERQKTHAKSSGPRRR